MELDNLRKIEINNQIVLLRHAVRKARVGVVWKLTKETKHLKSRKGEQKIIDKCHRKAEKLIEEMHELKKIKDDEVNRFALTKACDKTLLDSNPSIKTKAMLRLSSHKTLKDKIEEFKRKYPDYEMYMHIKSKKNTLPSKSYNKKEQNNKKTIENGWVVEDIDNNRLINKVVITEENSNNLDNNPNKINSFEDKNNRLQAKKNKLNTLKKKKIESINIVSNIAEVKKLKIDDNIMEDNKIVKQSNNNINNECSLQCSNDEVNRDKGRIEKEVDTFFVTDNNSEGYMSVAVPKHHVPDETKFDDRRNRFSYKKENDMRKMKYNQIKNNRNNDNFIQKNHHLKESSMRNNKQQIKHVKSNSTEKEEMHPSWMARKRQQDLIKTSTFQGKKIIFSDD